VRMLSEKSCAPGDGTVSIQFRVPQELKRELDKLTEGDRLKCDAFCVRALTQAVFEANRLS